MSRFIERQGFDDATRLRLVEGDVDALNADIGRVRDGLRSEIAELKSDTRSEIAEVKSEADGLRKLLTGLLVAVVTTSITIVATVLIAGGAR